MNPMNADLDTPAVKRSPDGSGGRASRRITPDNPIDADDKHTCGDQVTRRQRRSRAQAQRRLHRQQRQARVLPPLVRRHLRAARTTGGVSKGFRNPRIP